MRPRHTAEKGARARARPPARLSGAFPSPAPDGRSSRRPLGTWPGGVGVGGLRGQASLRPPAPPAPREEAELKGLLPHPLPGQDVCSAIGSILRSPTSCKRAKVCGPEQTTTVPEGGGRDEGFPSLLGRLCLRSLCRVWRTTWQCDSWDSSQPRLFLEGRN